MKSEKTNVMRLLDAQKIDYEAFEYDAEKYVSGVEVAKALGEDEDALFKTLVTYSEKAREHFVFCIPSAYELDLKKAAEAVGVKDIEMIRQKELLPLTGYVHGGCSPIGMKKLYPTIADSTAECFDTIIFSAGKIGYQVELSFENLNKVIKVTPADICKD